MDTSDSVNDQGSEQRNARSAFGIFARGLNFEKKVKADGQPPKRRGPKPDAKPALTRRQELNRQAQRTHRERKEIYIKALEQEVLRLKETYGTICRSRDAFAEENKRLRELLAAHGINCPADLNSPLLDPRSPGGVSSSGSFSGTYAPPSSTTDPIIGAAFGNRRSPDVINGYPTNGPSNGLQQSQQAPQYNFNVDQSQESDEDISGHVLMASCPPANHLRESPHVQYPHQLSPDIAGGDLLKLLDLSARLPLEGEITPVMAWAIIIRDSRFGLLSESDIKDINQELMTKVRCYGFGAVLEEFEVKDALEGVLASKMEKLNVSA